MFKPNGIIDKSLACFGIGSNENVVLTEFEIRQIFIDFSDVIRCLAKQRHFKAIKIHHGQCFSTSVRDCHLRHGLNQRH